MPLRDELIVEAKLAWLAAHADALEGLYIDADKVDFFEPILARSLAREADRLSERAAGFDEFPQLADDFDLSKLEIGSEEEQIRRLIERWQNLAESKWWAACATEADLVQLDHELFEDWKQSRRRRPAPLSDRVAISRTLSRAHHRGSTRQGRPVRRRGGATARSPGRSADDDPSPDADPLSRPSDRRTA